MKTLDKKPLTGKQERAGCCYRAARALHPIHCILPPHLLEQIAEKGSEGQKMMARRALAVSERTRGERQAFAFMPRMVVEPRGDKYREVYDAKTGDELPGVLVRREGDGTTGDPAVDDAYDGAGTTYDLFFDAFDRNSIDGLGMRLVSSVHYLVSYDNAFWNGRQMVYGDGDEDLPESERLWNRFTAAIDVIGHELAHGVTQFEANLAYRFQSGALSESFSDVFGSLVKQYHLNQTADQADWLIGAGLLTDNVNGIALRSMKEPGTAYDDPVLGKDPQPGHMNEYKKLPNWYDNGGVHINSGIPNHAFYFVATELGGYAWQKAGLVWYITLRDKLRRNSDFQTAADQTFLVAGKLFGPDSAEQKAVRNGWQKVGINGQKRKGKKGA